ncbi:MAG: EpsG family protein [Lachnospiraceae bacterium]|nr:EpsG family protein [Lachnospiraceae bacterium]
MQVFRLNFLFPLFWGALFFLVDLYREDPQATGHGKLEERKKTSWLYVILVTAPLVYFATTRDWFGDTGNYLGMFRRMPDTWAGLVSYMEASTKDRGFFFLSGLIRVFISQDTVVYLAIFALLHGFALAYFFRKYSPHYAVSLFLFIGSVDYIMWMYNGMRQFMAVCIILFAVPFLLKRKYIPVILIVLLASTMHQSALIMIPFFFIAQGKAWNFKTLLYLLGVLVAIAYIGNFTSLLDDVLQETQYASALENYEAWDDGTNPFRVAVYALPAVISFFLMPHIEYEKDPVVNLSVNMSILTTGLYLISMVSSGLILGRLPIYTSLFNYILLPWEVDHGFTSESRRILYIGMFAAYLVFFYYQMHIAWGYI